MRPGAIQPEGREDSATLAGNGAPAKLAKTSGPWTTGAGPGRRGQFEVRQRRLDLKVELRTKQNISKWISFWASNPRCG